MATFAQKVGCSYAHLSPIERGTRRPSPALAHRIAHVLTGILGRPVTLDEFFVPRPRRRTAG